MMFKSDKNKSLDDFGTRWNLMSVEKRKSAKEY